MQHKAITAANIHVFAYVQNTDPGAVGAGIGWVDTTSTPHTLKIRNAGDTAWEAVGASTTTLAALTDVDLTGLADGDVIAWHAASSQWIVATATSGVFTAIASQLEAEAGSNNTKGMTPLRVAQAIAALSPAGATTLHALTDVNDTGKSNGQVLTYDTASSKWIPATPTTGATNLDGLSDVVITTPSTDQVLKYNGSNWVNGAAPSGSAASPFNPVTWGSTFDTFGGTSFVLADSNHTISKTNNDSTFRTGAYDLTSPISDEGVYRHIVGYTPNGSTSGGAGVTSFGLAHTPTSMPNGLAYMDFEYYVSIESTTASTIFANGSAVGTTFAVNINDVVEYKVIKNSQGVRQVSLWVNGNRIYQWATAPTMNLYPTCALYHQGRTFNAKIATFIPA